MCGEVQRWHKVPVSHEQGITEGVEEVKVEDKEHTNHVLTTCGLNDHLALFRPQQPPRIVNTSRLCCLISNFRPDALWFSSPPNICPSHRLIPCSTSQFLISISISRRYINRSEGGASKSMMSTPQSKSFLLIAASGQLMALLNRQPSKSVLADLLKSFRKFLLFIFYEITISFTFRSSLSGCM
jgi:hypothetical protein